MSLKSLLDKIANTGLHLQQDNGAMPAGNNGPYMDKETPVRNSAHWLYIFSCMFERAGDKKWEKAANKAVDYLCSSESRPMKGAFWCRLNPEKDFCNGVVGQAWVIESLIKASEVLNREDCYNLAEEVFFLHPWDENAKIWRRLNVDGSYTSPDFTFNHQLWFGAIVGFLKRTEEAQKRSKIFFENAIDRLLLSKKGILLHHSPLIKYSYNPLRPFQFAKTIYSFNRALRLKKLLWLKSTGYHAFNLYAFSLYKRLLPDHPFWSSGKFKKMLSVINRPEFVSAQNNNPYSFPYNPTGFELAFTIETFNKNEVETIQWWLQQQINKTMDLNRAVKIKNSNDNMTTIARIYEAFRIKGDFKISY